MEQEKEIKTLRKSITELQEQIKRLDSRTQGHGRTLDQDAEIRAIAERTVDRLIEMVADHSERIKAIEAQLWPGIAHDHKAIRKIVGGRGKPGAGEEFDKRK